MVAVEALSGSATAILFFVAFVAFVVAGVLAYISRALWATLISAGLAVTTFVAFWNSLAVS